jgi:3-oxoacyl-(acyl-carrier-protein) synthase
MTERVVVTGLGVVSPLGGRLGEFWDALLYGESVPQVYPHLPARAMSNRHAYWLRDVPSAGPGGPHSSRTVRIATEAVRAALDEAGVPAAPGADVVGLCLGTATGNHDLVETAREAATPIPDSGYPFTVATTVAEALALSGPVLTISTACAAGCCSVALAAEAILDGQADVMVAAGADTISRVTQACFNRMNALADDVCRPFDARRTGTMYGEGAAALVLESERHARQRGSARIYAEVKGSGWSCDGHHATAPDPSAAEIVRALRRALADAGVGPDAIDCVVAHGTGTELNDLAESHAMEQVFGGAVDRILVCAPKSKLGHTAGASGAFACVVASLILDRGLVPPTANLTSVDPRCRLRLHADWPVPASARHVLVNAYAFGGNNVSVILGAA